MANGSALDRQEQVAKIVASYGGLLLPVAVLVATAWFNHNNTQIAARQKCIDQSLAIVGSSYAQPHASPTLEDERQQRLATLGELMVQSCSKSNVTVPPLVRATLERESRKAEGTAAGAALNDVAARAEPERAQDPDVAAAAAVPAISQPAGTVLLFIHIDHESQRVAAEQLGRQLQGIAFQGRTIAVQGVELVPGRGDNSLRCLKRADCEEAQAFADVINARLAAPQVRPVDLSARFENAARVAPGTFELWFGSGELRPR